jgi:pimeloyl-ACP methyl ester carboxylesterase
VQHHLVELPPHAFWVHESGAGTPVVLIHGLGGSSDWWRYNIEELAREYRVLAVDLVGFGRNRFFLRRSRLPLRFDEIAALLVRWIETLGEAVHLVGNSMGGQVAIHVAAARPDLVRSLTLVNSSGIPFEIAPGAHIENLIVPRGAMSFATILARDLLRAGPTSMTVAFTHVLRDDVRPLLRGLAVPVLLAWGERDPLVPLTYARQMMEIIPNSRLQVIPRAGHIPMWENPRAFNDALLEFLRSVEDSRPRLSSHVFSWALAGWADGIAHREAGRSRDVVLLHGLGMSSEYFVHFARALVERGWSPIAPDLPGFGESRNGPAVGPREQGQLLISWADALNIREAIWIGHSLGCNDAVHVARARPDLVRKVVCIGPLWSSKTPIRLLGALLLDAFRESFTIFYYVISAYWRCGLWRWFATLRRYEGDLRSDPPGDAMMIAGNRDPLPDRDRIPNLVFVNGAHACQFTYPHEVVSAAIGSASEKILGGVAKDQNDQRDHESDDRYDPLSGAAGDSE